ncbi:DUF6338 family protein [Modestobacter sp. VKM Ac-2983]|uniref:DUF6338 family protein n=1 Tax=Modestobacter sp. VKM Ac-2983 TaxID=3004137 RepID=UPI0022AB98C3|nr:DUF6338 family protein [Modestobacter sp. VKM Ac-2983]MCZ2806432.1 DUF6338 family protein [Modestobacter sp. VKM Ac-2983]
MPDSLTALAILALVGVPGYVYLQLRPAQPSSDGETASDGRASGLNENLETVFFGLACALGGAVLSLIALGRSWSSVFKYSIGDESVQADLPLDIVGIVTTSFAGSLLTAILLAGLVRWLQFWPEKSSRSIGAPAASSKGSADPVNPLPSGDLVTTSGGRPGHRATDIAGEMAAARRQAAIMSSGALVGLVVTGLVAWVVSLA